MAKKFKDNTQKFYKAWVNHVDKNLITATLLVERTAKILSPVDTGALRRSITHEFLSKREAIVGSNLEYAPHVELGTVKMAAQPFLRPALHANLKKIRKLLGGK